MPERLPFVAPSAEDTSEADGASSAFPRNLAPGGELDQLRSLLFQREINFLHTLENRLNDPTLQAKEVSNVLAEAILLRAGKDERLSAALQPTVEQIFSSSVRRHPQQLATTLFPLMGPAIRKSIAEAIHSMLQGLNKALEMAFSWRGLRWRFEALRTGKSFAEVVLLHTLIYRVEQIYLIHAETGILLGHVSGEGVSHQDADLVSGMLTAVQDFVRDCFAQGNDDSLDTLQMGERTLMVEKGPVAVLACVVRGTPPAAFRGKLRDTIDMIHVEGAEYLAQFDGDVSAFSPLTRHMEACLDARYVDENKPLPFYIKWLPVALLLLALGLGGFTWWRNHTMAVQQHHFQSVIAKLNDIPGLVVVSTKGNPAKGWTIMLMQDPLAPDPRAILTKQGIAENRCTLLSTPFASLEPEMVTERIKRAMNPPPNVTITFADGVLSLKGAAPFDWILATTEKALGLPGVERVDTTQIVDPRLARLKTLIAQIEATRIEFPIGKDVPTPEEQRKLILAVDKLAELSKLSNSMGLSATLLIYGHADPTGSEKRNYELSESRATTFASMLYSRGVAMPVSVYGFGSEYSAPIEEKTGQTSQLIRRVELRVHVTSQGKSLVTGDGH